MKRIRYIGFIKTAYGFLFGDPGGKDLPSHSLTTGLFKSEPENSLLTFFLNPRHTFGIALVLLGSVACAVDGQHAPDATRDTLVTIRKCMAETPGPWPQTWLEEYGTVVERLLSENRKRSRE